MNFTYKAFSKAAKRLSVSDGSKLSDAQEKLSQILGFSNHHAAQKALQSNLSQDACEDMAGATYAGRYWLGLNWMEALELITLNGAFDSDDPWGSRAMDLLRFVSVGVFSRDFPWDVNTGELMNAFDLDSLAKQASEIITSRNDLEQAKHHALLNYIRPMLVSTGASFFGGRRLHRLRANAHEQHGYLTMHIMPALQPMMMLELVGASHDEVRALLTSLRADPGSVAQKVAQLNVRAYFARKGQ